MIVDAPAIDWLTLTSFYPEVHAYWDTVLHTIVGELTERKIHVYSGLQRGAFFSGSGVQKNVAHYMARAEGELADELTGVLLEGMHKCTRIDLQITLEIPDGYTARLLADELQDAEWDRAQPQIKLYENTYGLGTVAIGSRESERYIRIYTKRGEAKDFLRFEVECKGDRAQQTWHMIGLGVSKGSFLKDTIRTLPRDSYGIIDKFDKAIDDVGANLKIGRHEKDDSTTFRWLETAVSSAVARMLNDHDYGERTRKLIEKWLRKVSSVT